MADINANGPTFVLHTITIPQEEVFVSLFLDRELVIGPNVTLRELRDSQPHPSGEFEKASGSLNGPNGNVEFHINTLSPIENPQTGDTGAQHLVEWLASAIKQAVVDGDASTGMEVEDDGSGSIVVEEESMDLTVQMRVSAEPGKSDTDKVPESG